MLPGYKTQQSLGAVNRQLQVVTAERDMLRDMVSEQQEALARSSSGAPYPTPTPRRRQQNTLDAAVLQTR